MKITFYVNSGNPTKDEFNTAYNVLEGAMGDCSINSIVYDSNPDLILELDCDGTTEEDIAVEAQDAIVSAKYMLIEDFGIKLDIAEIQAI